MEKKIKRKSSIEKALDLIEALKESEDLGVTELSNILGLNKNNVFRLLATLEVKGIIEQEEETGHYKLGTKALFLEYAYLKGLAFLQEAKPFMKMLRTRVNETVYLSILSKDNIVYLHAEETNRSVLVHSRISKRFPAEKTTSGKVLLKARQSKEVVFPIEVDFEGLEPEVSEISTVIWEDKNPIASISIVAPISRLNQINYKDIEFELLNCAKKITNQLS